MADRLEGRSQPHAVQKVEPKAAAAAPNQIVPVADADPPSGRSDASLSWRWRRNGPTGIDQCGNAIHHARASSDKVVGIGRAVLDRGVVVPIAVHSCVPRNSDLIDSVDGGVVEAWMGFCEPDDGSMLVWSDDASSVVGSESLAVAFGRPGAAITPSSTRSSSHRRAEVVMRIPAPRRSRVRRSASRP